MVFSILRAQHTDNDGLSTLFSSSNSSLSSLCSAGSYGSSLSFTPASSTSSLSLPPFSKLGNNNNNNNNNNKSLPALPTKYDIDPSLQQQQHESSILPKASSFSPSSTKAVKAKRRRSDKTDSTKVGKIPRSPNSFMIYRREQVPLHRGLMASQLSMILGKKWRAESAERKAHFSRLAQSALEEHRRKYPQYRFLPAKRGTGKKAQAANRAAVAATSVAFTSTTAETLTSASLTSYPVQGTQSYFFASLSPTKNNSRPSPDLQGQQTPYHQSQIGSSSHWNPASCSYSSTSSSLYTSSLISQRPSISTPLKYPTTSCSLLFDPYGSLPSQQTMLALLSNPPTPQTPLPSMNPLDRITTSMQQHQPIQAERFSSSSNVMSSGPQPLLSPSSLSTPPLSMMPLSSAYGSPIDFSWETRQFEGTSPTHTSASAAYIAQAMRGVLYQTCPDYFTLAPSQGLSSFSSLRAVTSPMPLSMPSQPSATPSASPATPAWTFHPLSSGIMMENELFLSPSLSPCSSLSSSASPSFSEMSPLHLMSSQFDPSLLLNQEKVNASRLCLMGCNDDATAIAPYA